jgi:hypothetical protein
MIATRFAVVLGTREIKLTGQEVGWGLGVEKAGAKPT